MTNYTYLTRSGAQTTTNAPLELASEVNEPKAADSGYLATSERPPLSSSVLLSFRCHALIVQL